MIDRAKYQREWYLRKKTEDPDYCRKRREKLLDRDPDYERKKNQERSESGYWSEDYIRRLEKDPHRGHNNYVKNKGAYARKSREREGMLKQQTPGWANLKAINEFYKNCPKGYHVDHIIPLKHKLVAGLHMLNNLQYLPAKENMKKHNKFVPHFEPVTIYGRAI